MEFLDMLVSMDVFKKSPFSNSLTYPQIVSIIFLSYMMFFFRLYICYLRNPEPEKRSDETAKCELITKDGDKSCKQSES